MDVVIEVRCVRLREISFEQQRRGIPCRLLFWCQRAEPILQLFNERVIYFLLRCRQFFGVDAFRRSFKLIRWQMQLSALKEVVLQHLRRVQPYLQSIDDFIDGNY